MASRRKQRGYRKPAKKVDIRTGKLVRARARRHQGLAVHEEDHPSPPGPWIDAEECRFCGARFDDETYGVTWEEGWERLRRLNRRAGTGGGGAVFSRGPVLWAMHTEKLERWYLDHLERHGFDAQWAMEQGWDPERERFERWAVRSGWAG